MIRKYLSGLFALLMLWTMLVVPAAPRANAQSPQKSAPEQRAVTSLRDTTPAQFAEAQAALVTEFDVNGLKVLVKKRAGSQTVAVGLFLRGGSRNITEKNAGVEDLMLDVASEASVGFPREQLRTELSRMGTVIGSGVNSDYSAISMGTTRDNFDRSWEIFTDVVLHPSFTQEDFDRVKNRNVLSLRDDVDTPESYLQTLLEHMAYAGHPYANSPRGTVETVSKLSLKDVRRYHAHMMETSRLLLVVVGDLDADVLRTRIASTFGKLRRGKYQSKPIAQLSFDSPTLEVTQRSLPTNYIQGIFVAPALTDNDINAMRIATNILAQLLYQEVREKRNLSYAPDAFLNSQGANIGGISVSAVDANQTVRVMFDQIALLQENRFMPEIISNVVAGYLTNYYVRLETNAAQAGELGQYELIGGGWRNSISIIERLRAVTPEDVQRVSQKYLRNIRFVVLGNPASIDKKIFLTQSGD